MQTHVILVTKKKKSFIQSPTVGDLFTSPTVNAAQVLAPLQLSSFCQILTRSRLVWHATCVIIDLKKKRKMPNNQ